MVGITTPSWRARFLSATVALSCLLAGPLGKALAGENPRSKALPEKGRTTRVFRLENAVASEVAAAIEKSAHRGEQAQSEGTSPTDIIVAVPDKPRNLVVVSCPAGMIATIDSLIAALDKRPATFKISCKHIQIGPDGKQHVSARPMLMTRDGQPAEVTIGQLVPVVAPELKASHVQAGYSISLEVHLARHDTARLEASINHQEVDKSSEGGVRLVRKSVQIIQTIRLDSPVKLVVDKADDGSARSWWEVIVSEIQAEPTAGAAGGQKRAPEGREASPSPDATHRATLQTTKG